MIHRGSMPKLWENPDFDWQMFYLLKPYSNNITKRAVKTPKLYFLDTGLAAYLTKWNTVDVLKNGAMAGAFFESFVISEIIKSYYKRIFWPLTCWIGFREYVGGREAWSAFMIRLFPSGEMTV